MTFSSREDHSRVSWPWRPALPGPARVPTGAGRVAAPLLSSGGDRPAAAGARFASAPGMPPQPQPQPGDRGAERRPRAIGREASRDLLAGLLRLALAALLLGAGGLRLAELAGPAALVDTYRLLPETLLLPSATFLALAEVALGGWLLVGGRTAGTALAASLLHAGYLAWLGLALDRDLGLPAGGGFAVLWPRPLTAGTLAQDALLLATAVVLLHRARRRGSPAGSAGTATRDG